MNRRSYHKEMESIISRHRERGESPSLMLHCCCAPCSSHVLELLSSSFRITALYYNPNIQPESEYEKRAEELERLVLLTKGAFPVTFRKEPYDPTAFLKAAKGLENEPEGGARCSACFELRLEKAASLADELGMDYFTTTLTISPLKDVVRINSIGERLSEKYRTAFVPSDFKKQGGYQRSVELSRQYGLYRQNYCGCVFSRKEI